ncbi:MAG TPA: DUF2845 domain-containing protein [Rhodanobacteraceae bacterium]|nr:DUF2845 domain-containing protein [Rhodanobacteraceae bacterium]
MKRVLPMLFALPLLLAWAHPAWALRCGTRLVEQGDQDFQVRERCGDPFFVDSYATFARNGTGAPIETGVETVYDAWYYNFGPQQLMVRLLFANGELVREQTLGYGFNGSGGPCNLDIITDGMSSGELYARCGAPAERRQIYGDALLRDGFHGARLLVPRIHEEWFYPARGGDRAREVLLLNGRVEDVKVVD